MGATGGVQAENPPTPEPTPLSASAPPGEHGGALAEPARPVGLSAGWRARLAGWVGNVRRLVCRTVGQAWSDRVLGLSAEAGFWALLSLTPLLLVLVAGIGYLTPLFGAGVVGRVESRILAAAEQVLAPSAVQQVIEPVLADVLRHGRGGIVSAGFVLALWTGSAAMSTYVNAITIAYGMRDVRSAVRARVLAFGLYLGALAAGVITLPLLVAAPGWIIAATPEAARDALSPVVRYGYWPVLIVVCTGLLVVLYHLATPVRGRWRRDLPGAVVAMGLWLGGSLALRWFLSVAIAHNAAYGVLAAPAAALLFLYVTALAVLLGAELNAQLSRPEVPMGEVGRPEGSPARSAAARS